MSQLSEEEAKAAIQENNGTDLKGAALRVDEANPRPVRVHQSRGDRRGSGPRRGGSGSERGGSRGGTRSY